MNSPIDYAYAVLRDAVVDALYGVSLVAVAWAAVWVLR